MIPPMLAANPTMWTGMMAFVRGVIFASTSLGSSISDSSISAITGRAPRVSGARAVEMKVYPGTITSSPGPTCIPASAQTRAAVPLVTSSAWSAPTLLASAFSNLAHSSAWPSLGSP